MYENVLLKIHFNENEHKYLGGQMMNAMKNELLKHESYNNNNFTLMHLTSFY